MEYDEQKVDDAVLALLFLTMFDDQPVMPGCPMFRAWKSHDRDVLNRLSDKGFIRDPRNKAKSVVLTEAGRERSEELFRKLFV